MSNTKFTKGEWVVINKEPGKYEKETVNNCVKMVDSAKTKYDANVYCVLGGFDRETQKDEIESNAHLIAAAPEMYEILSSIVNQIESADLNGIDTHPIKSLLAKARGEQ